MTRRSDGGVGAVPAQVLRCRSSRRPSHRCRWGRLATAGLVLATAQAGAPGQTQTVVVTGSVAESRVQDAPYAIGVVDADELAVAGPRINLSEALARVPGLVVNNRSNYAQDLQVGARGFGARSTFGVRGLRLYADGIPASGPDGQGQVSHFDIAGAERVEVLRGPFSALYGNSSGGVIAIFTAPARERRWGLDLDVGSFGLRQGRASMDLPLSGGWDLRASLSRMAIDGFRPQSAAAKSQAALRLGWAGERDRVVVVLNHLDQPADDPLGLDRATFDLGPRGTAPQAIAFDTRKLTAQTQLGASWRHRFDDGALREARFAAYAGTRSVTQWLAIPAAAQASPRHGGGVIDFDRGYGGVDARLRWAWDRIDLEVGAAHERQRDDRLGFENFTGTGAAQVVGVTGRLRRDERNTARSSDVFAQAEWRASDGLAVVAGVRSGRVELASRDAYLANGDDSGVASYRYANPVLGLRWRARPSLTLHASVARGFESPTLGELAYRPDGSGGFNDALRPQKSRQWELGAKWRAGAAEADLALFEARTDDELAVATNAGGRASFRNIGRTLRRGAELAAAVDWTPAWRTRIAASVLDAKVRDGFLACAGIPCTAPTVPVPAGSRIAGTPTGTAWGEMVWRGGIERGWGEWGLELRASGSVAVNDLNADAAPRYTLAALRWRKAWDLPGGLTLQTLARVDNLADRHHAGSVIVNDANGRHYEPGAPRSVWIGIRLGGGF